jgi:nitrate reductase delta subunit
VSGEPAVRPPAGDLVVLRALAALLAYPDAEIIAALPEIAEVVARSELVGRAARDRLAELVHELATDDPLALEERYVGLFDRGRTTSLNLFEHVHGESRDRGQAMVELVQMYEQAGLRLAAHELPDHLPVLLEYLSCRSHDEVRAMLGDCAHIVRAIGEALAKRGSRYAAALDAVLAVADEPGLDWSRASEAPPAEPPIDQEWADAPAFGTAEATQTQTQVMHFVPRTQPVSRDAPNEGGTP